MWQVTVFDTLSFLSHAAGTANRTRSGGSSHCRNNSGLEFVSVAMTDVEHKSECLRGLRLTTVVTDWRLDNQQGGRWIQGRDSFCIWELLNDKFSSWRKHRSKLIHMFLSFGSTSFKTATLENGYKISASCSKTGAVKDVCLCWWILLIL